MTQQLPTKNYTILQGLDMGLFAPKHLATILEIVNKYNVPAAKLTGAQRLALLGMEEEEMQALYQELQPYLQQKSDNGITYIQACPGKQWCKYGQKDALAMGDKIGHLQFMKPFTAKVKIGVSGCRMCCTQPYLRDVGAFASKSGWSLIFGGNGGGRPRIGDVIASRLSDEELLELIKKCLSFYQKEAMAVSRTSRFMESYGVEKFKEHVL